MDTVIFLSRFSKWAANNSFSCFIRIQCDSKTISGYNVGALATLVLYFSWFIFFFLFCICDEASHCFSLKLHFPAMKSLSLGKISSKPTVQLTKDLKDSYFMSFIISFQAADTQTVKIVHYLTLWNMLSGGLMEQRTHLPPFSPCKMLWRCCENTVLPPVLQRDWSGCYNGAERLKTAALCYLWAWGHCPLRGCGCCYLCHLTHTKQLRYITLLLSFCFSNTVAKSGPSQLWTTHYCFHKQTESDSRGHQLVIHYRNMEAYHEQQKHRSLSSTTKKIGKQRIYQCLHVFIDLILIWAVTRFQSTYFFTYGTCVEAAACVQQACEKKKRLTKGFHLCPGVISVEVTVCPWDDGSLAAAALMQADGSLHLHNRENNSVLHRGLHPPKLWDNVSDFHGERRRQSITFSSQWHKAITPAVLFPFKSGNWQSN